MCLLVVSKTGAMLGEDQLRNAHENNPDSWGIVWRTKSKKLEVVKGFNRTSLMRACKRAEGHPYMLHFRWATHGANDIRNAHPFKVRDGLYMAHNGIIPIEQVTDPTLSDTGHFAAKVAQWLVDYPTFYAWEGFSEWIGKYVGLGNKIAFFDNRGKITIVNEDQGFRVNGDSQIWVSNLTSLNPPFNWDAYEKRKSQYKQDSWFSSACYVKRNSRIKSDPLFSRSERIELGADEALDCEWCSESMTECFDYDGNVICPDCYRLELEYFARHGESLTSSTDDITDEDLDRMAAKFQRQ